MSAVGEDDSEEGASIAVKDTSVNETQGEEDLGDPNQPVTNAARVATATDECTPVKINTTAAAAAASPDHSENNGKVSPCTKVKSEDVDESDSEEVTEKLQIDFRVPSSNCKRSPRPSTGKVPSRNTNGGSLLTNKAFTGMKVSTSKSDERNVDLEDEEDDDDAEEEDDIAAAAAAASAACEMNARMEGESETGVPLDFSVKQLSSAMRKSNKRKCDSGEGDEEGRSGGKKKKGGDGGGSFPLDLSVKRPSMHSSRRGGGGGGGGGGGEALLASPSSSSPSPSSLSSSSSSFLAASAAKFVTQSPPTKGSSVSLVSPSLRGPSSINGSDRPCKTSKSLQTPQATRSVNSHGRQNPWQTQWINRSSEQTRDVFTCVWCKESFRSLQEMTIHMKESPRCGMAGIQQAAAASASSLAATSAAAASAAAACNTAATNVSPGSLNGANSSPSSVKSSLNRQSLPSSSKEPASNSVLAKNTVTLPRKLVRGQDVWLGRGAEQTRQILKCMWCAQSFKTLEEMTEHMQVTQHYRKIVSQEQIISWRTPEAQVTQAQLNAVLTCKVCDEAFGSLKELSYHMVKNSHYKEHILRSITEGGHGRRRQARERRKKSLPVRKLLELERMEIQQPRINSGSGGGGGNLLSSSSAVSKLDHRSSKSPQVENKQPTSSYASGQDATRGSTESGLLCTCDECGEKVEAKHLITHLRSCKIRTNASDGTDGGARSPSSTSSRPESSGPHSRSPGNRLDSPPPPTRKSIKSEKNKDSHDQVIVNSSASLNCLSSKSGTSHNNSLPGASSSSACLSALQSLIEKSFDLKVPGATATAATSSSSAITAAAAASSASSGGKNKNIISDTDHKKSINGTRANNHQKESAKGLNHKSPLSASLSAVEKWMTLAKERDSAANHLWSSSMSSSSSSWLCSDDEPDEAATLALALKNKLIKGSSDDREREVRSPASSGGTSSRPASVPRPQTASPSDLTSATVTSHKHTKRSSKAETKVKEEDRQSAEARDEEERREEIEELKRNAGRCFTSSPLSPKNNAASSSSAVNALTAAASSSTSLSALERLIEKSFDSKKKNTPTGFLQRLGIDEEVCPPWQPGLGLTLSALPFASQLPFQPWLIPKHEGRSNTSSPSKGTKNGSLSSSPPV